jgi:hypothetical protein
MSLISMRALLSPTHIPSSPAGAGDSFFSGASVGVASVSSRRLATDTAFSRAERDAHGVGKRAYAAQDPLARLGPEERSSL